MRNLRVAFIGGALSYRALFDWMSPALFVSAMLATPVFQVLFFADLGPAYSQQPAEFFAVGNAVQACAMAGVVGVSQTIANERLFGTMGQVVLTPANRLALYVGRSLPHVVTGLAISATGLVLSWAVTDFWVPPSQWWALLLVLVVTAASCTAIGVPFGAAGLLSRDTNVMTSLMYLVLLLVSGAAVPVADLPAVLRWAGEVLPLGHGIEALRHLVSDGVDATFAGLVLQEALVGTVILILGTLLLQGIEVRARRRGDLDLF